MYTELNAAEEARPCARCGEPLASAMFVGDLQATLDELGQNYRSRAGADVDAAHLTELCPRCKRVERGRMYYTANGRGFGR